MIIGRNCTVGSDGIPSQRVCFPVIISDHSFTASYDSNSSPYEITRRGLLDDGSYGGIDSLRFCLDGNPFSLLDVLDMMKNLILFKF